MPQKAAVRGTVGRDARKNTQFTLRWSRIRNAWRQYTPPRRPYPCQRGTHARRPMRQCWKSTSERSADALGSCVSFGDEGLTGIDGESYSQVHCPADEASYKSRRLLKLHKADVQTCYMIVQGDLLALHWPNWWIRILHGRLSGEQGRSAQATRPG
jgi:hypothetical protein